MVLFSGLKRCFSSDKNLYRTIKNIFGFYPENIFIYKLALLHKSAANKEKSGFSFCNERLEYLGDAVLSLIIADFLFKKFPYKDEGFLTEIRSKIVSRNHLNQLSEKLGLNKLLITSGDALQSSKSINGDAFEAFIGAIYLDKGYRFTKKIVINHLLAIHVDIDEIIDKEVNFKSRIIEWAQKEKKNIKFSTSEEINCGNRKQYIVELLIEEKVVAKGQDFSIKKAEQNAAEIFCNQHQIFQVQQKK